MHGKWGGRGQRGTHDGSSDEESAPSIANGVAGSDSDDWRWARCRSAAGSDDDGSARRAAAVGRRGAIGSAGVEGLSKRGLEGWHGGDGMSVRDARGREGTTGRAREVGLGGEASCCGERGGTSAGSRQRSLDIDALYVGERAPSHALPTLVVEEGAAARRGQARQGCLWRWCWRRARPGPSLATRRERLDAPSGGRAWQLRLCGRRARAGGTAGEVRACVRVLGERLGFRAGRVGRGGRAGRARAREGGRGGWPAGLG